MRKPAREPVPRGAREVAEFVDRTQDVADALDDLFAELRQRDLSRASLQQHAAEDFLHFLDLHRQRRLRDRTCLRRASEMAVTCQRIEVAKLSERRLDHQIILSVRSLKSTLPDGRRCLDCFQSDRNHQETTMDDKTKCPFTGGNRATHEPRLVAGRAGRFGSSPQLHSVRSDGRGVRLRQGVQDASTSTP